MEVRPKSSKSSVRRRPSSLKLMAAASSPSPDTMSAFNACGHDGCHEGGCNVRYVGPVSHLRDHHALHAARGVAHVWTAAIVSGLAVVVTGFLAYNAAQAVAPARGPSPDMRAIMQRLDRMEEMMRTAIERCSPPEEDRREDEHGDEVSPPAEDRGHSDVRPDGRRGDMPPPPGGGDHMLPGGDHRSPPPIPPPIIPPPAPRADGGAPAVGGGATEEVRP